MRVCIFSKTFHPVIGGLERCSEILAVELNKHKGVDVTVLTDSVSHQFKKTVNSFNIVRDKSFFIRYLTFRQSDVILFMNVSLKGYIPALLSGRKIVLSHHGVYIANSSVGIPLEFMKRMISKFYINICCSKFVSHKIYGKKIVIKNPYDDILFKSNNLSQKDRDFVFCGRLIREKGCHIAIRAFSKIIHDFPDAKLSIIGNGVEYGALKLEAIKLGIDKKNIYFLGEMAGAKLVAELNRHHCLLVPSLWEEPFGIVALEGLACCSAVIVSRRGGLPEAVGKVGIVVEPTEMDFYIAMARIYADSMIGKLHNASRFRSISQHLDNHLAKKVAGKYLQVLKLALRI